MSDRGLLDGTVDCVAFEYRSRIVLAPCPSWCGTEDVFHYVEGSKGHLDAYVKLGSYDYELDTGTPMAKLLGRFEAGRFDAKTQALVVYDNLATRHVHLRMPEWVRGGEDIEAVSVSEDIEGKGTATVRLSDGSKRRFQLEENIVVEYIKDEYERTVFYIEES